MEQVQVLFERKMHEYLTPRNSTIRQEIMSKEARLLLRISESLSPHSKNSLIKEKFCNLVKGHIKWVHFGNC